MFGDVGINVKFQEGIYLYQLLQVFLSINKNYLVVSTRLKNIRKIGSFPQVGVKQTC